MATTRLDITLAARAARHLYMMTAICGLILLIVWISWLFVIALAFPFRADPIRWLLVIGVAAFLVGSTFAVYCARRELNGSAYVTAAFCTAVLLMTFCGLAFDGPQQQIKGADDVVAEVIGAIIVLLVVAYSARVLIDFGRLALGRYGALNIAPLKLANDVSKFLRSTRSSVSPFHMPTNPMRTCIYVVLFIFVVLVVPQFLSGQSGLVLLLILGALVTLIRRHYVLRADRLLELDKRRPIVFLRSFGDDKVRLRPKGLLGKCQFRGKFIDEAIARLANRLGPFIAIANPTTELPHLGAAKTFYANDTWQGAIARWVGMAQLIIMVAGRTEGIDWELDYIFSNQAQHKLLIFFPPSFRKDPPAATQWLRDHFARTHYGAELLTIDPDKTIAIAFRDDGVFIIESRRRTEVDYFVAFQALIFVTVANTSAK
jgi:hypothetical protein